ncbi:MAG: hypothetical protein AABZ74_00940 [Cyanobacteriota bacterium]
MLISPNYSSFMSKYQSKEEIIRFLYIPAMIDSFNRVKQIPKISSQKENDIRNIFIKDIEYDNELLKDLIDNNIIKLTSEGQIIGENLEINRTDIELFISGVCNFVIECKNLRSADKRYLDEGIKRFIDEIYAKNDNYAGMMGFVVSGTFTTTTTKLPNKIENFCPITPKHSINLTLSIDGDYAEFLSKHKCKTTKEISIFHLLLKF